MMRINLDNNLSQLPTEFESRLADQLDQITQQIQQGQEPDVAELLADYPDMAETIHAYVRQIQLLQGAGGESDSNILGLADSTNSKSFRNNDTNATGDGADDGGADDDELRIGDYRIEHEIGRGGMGIVYAARQISLDRPVALKILPFAATLDQMQITRFRNEARAAGQLHHPNIVPVFAVGCEENIHFYAMQKIEGQSLESVFRSQKKQNHGTDEFSYIDTAPDHPDAESDADFKLAKKPGANPQAALPGKPFAENDWLNNSESISSFDTDATASLFNRSTKSPKETQPSGGASISGIDKLGDSVAYSTSGAAFEFAEPTNVEYHRQIATIGIQVAEALQYAHECGVIHRDIKPSNLMLDRKGKVWITDFGLARVQSDAGMTQTGDVIGTFRYMSPEQASGDIKILDQRTDVYSLGITLYELLTLHEAFHGLDRREMLLAIEEKDPVLPRRLNPSIPIDLETIVLKAVSKKPEQRYASSQEMADDLERFLDGRPTLARRPTLTERFAKWAGRHRAAVRGAMVMVVIAMIGFGITSLMIARAHNRVVDVNHQLKVAHSKLSNANNQLASALQESEENRLLALKNMRDATSNAERAEKNYRQARKVVDKLGSQYAEKLKKIDGAEELRQALLADTLAYYDQFIELSENDPSLGRDLALTYSKIGEISDQLGSQSKSLSSYMDAKRLLEKQVQQEPESPKHKADLALCLNNLGQLLDRYGKASEARNQFSAATKILDKLIEAHPKEDQYQADLAMVKHNQGLSNYRIGNLSDARAHLEAACDLQEPIVQRHPKNLTYKSRLAIHYSTLSRVCEITDRKKAIQSCSKAIDIQKQLVEEHPQQSELQKDLAISYHSLGVLQWRDGQNEQAADSYRKAIELFKELAKRAPAVVEYRYQLAISENNLGRIFLGLRQYAAAVKAFDNARQTLTSLVRDYPYDPNYHGSLGGTLNNLGMIFEKLGRHVEAAQTYFEAIRHQHEAYRLAPKVERHKKFLSGQYINYARTLRSLDRYEEAYKVIQAREKLWKGQPEKLLGLARETATLAKAMHRRFPSPTPEQAATYKKIAGATIEMLNKAFDAGVLTSESLQGTAFDDLRENQRFRMLTDKLNRS